MEVVLNEDVTHDTRCQLTVLIVTDMKDGLFLCAFLFSFFFTVHFRLKHAGNIKAWPK